MRKGERVQGEEGGESRVGEGGDKIFYKHCL